MFFSNLFRGGFGEPRHIRRTRNYLQEARMAMLEHAIAAEHYHASADMYAERVRRLEEELAQWAAQNGGEVVHAPEVHRVAASAGSTVGESGGHGKHKGGTRTEGAAPAMNAPASVGMARA